MSFFRWFRRRPSTPLTEGAYSRWVRAQRPPMELFLELDEDDQERLAEIGDAHLQDFAIAIGYGVRSPEMAEAALNLQGDGGDGDALAAITRQMAHAAQRSAGPGPTMAGTGGSKRTADLFGGGG